MTYGRAAVLAAVSQVCSVLTASADADATPAVRVVGVIGGAAGQSTTMSPEGQMADLVERQPQVVVATPGRLLTLTRGVVAAESAAAAAAAGDSSAEMHRVDLRGVRFFVLDEADRCRLDWVQARSFTHSLARSLARLLARSLTHARTYARTHARSHSLTRTPTHSLRVTLQCPRSLNLPVPVVLTAFLSGGCGWSVFASGYWTRASGRTC
jgi:superfamily II DNA/RNA helicase